MEEGIWCITSPALHKSVDAVTDQIWSGSEALMISFWLLLGTVVPAYWISLVAVAVVRRYAAKLGLLDRPGHRKIHLNPIPLGGGLGIGLGVIATFAIGSAIVFSMHAESEWIPDLVRPQWNGMRKQAGQLWLLLGGGLVLMLLGLLDDCRGLAWQLRLVVEVGIATAVVYGQGLQLTAFIDLPWFTGLLSVLWIVGLINAFNMMDNMDGLSGGVAAIVCGMLAMMLLTEPVSLQPQPQLFVAAMMLVLFGALGGFLFHNWPPAKIFMGDAGSYFIGYWIAIGTLLANYTGLQAERPHAVIAPLCLLAVPLYDMLSVIWIRLREGRSPFEGDKRHFSHRLVELGLSKKGAVLTIYLATVVTSSGALILPRTDGVGASIILVSVLCMIALIGILENTRPGETPHG